MFIWYVCKIESETQNAESQATDSLTEIEALKNRLTELEKKSLQNTQRRVQARNASESALKNVTFVQETASGYF